MDTSQLTCAPMGTVATFPASRPGYRLVPAALGAPSQGQRIVHIYCPVWCTQDHVSGFQHYIEDFSHSGDDYTVLVPSFLNDGVAVYEWSARVNQDLEDSDPRMRAAHVRLEDSTSIDAYLTPDMADETADDLIRLALKLREAARTARLHNAAGDSDPDMDEALRRVQGGAA